MELKKFLIRLMTLFFMMTTLITVAICVIGLRFDADARFGYESLLTPMIYAACCVLPSLVTFSRRELKPRELLMRMLLQFLLIEAIILWLAFRSETIDTSNPAVVLVIAGSVLVIYTLVRLFSWLIDSAEAKRMNADLIRFQQKHE